ncbi:MAG TPA: DOMON domain-containing protein, partial [Candidatus Sabulitectum sp.]|nr:DOMON domain-containing protein [Candidatus Sabulitectum sp.]
MKITMLVLAAIAAVSAGQAWQEITVDGFTLRWATVEGNNLAVQLNGPTTGWVAVGFDPTQMMLNANIIIGYV